MSLRHSGAFLGLATVLAMPLACKGPNTNVKIAEPGSESGEVARAPGGSAQPDAGPRPPVETIDLSGNLSGVGDMLDAGSKLFNMWSPPEPGAPAINLRDFISLTLIQEGFGPGFFESIDLDGMHAFELSFPHDGQPHATDQDVDLALSMAASNASRAIESMPAELQPQPMGQNMWQLAADDLALFFRAQPAAIEVAMQVEALDRAAGLPAKASPDPRIHLRAANLPSGDIDVSDLIPIPFGSRTLSSIANEVEAVELHADFGTARDLTARVEAEAPFERLGLDPIGAPTQKPSPLAQTLPGDAIAVWQMPWGDPKLLHDVLDKQVPVDQVPAPFDGYVGDVMGGAHTLLDAIGDEVLAAPYLDDKGNFSLVLAASVKDEAAARKAVRAMFGAAEKAFGDHIALAGKDPKHKYSVKFKQDGLKVGSHKADVFTLTIPKDKQDDLEGTEWLVGKKPKLEVSVVVAEGQIVLAMGAGQKAFMSRLGRRLGKKRSDQGLEEGGGLALARKLSAGCQYCVAVDPTELGEFVLVLFANDPDEPEAVRKAAKEGLAALRKLNLDGEVALAARFGKGRGALGFGIPQQLLFAKPDEVKKLTDILTSVTDAEDAEAAATSTSI